MIRHEMAANLRGMSSGCSSVRCRSRRLIARSAAWSGSGRHNVQTQSISIDAPPAVVLALVGDPTRLPDWAPTIGAAVVAKELETVRRLCEGSPG
jgi:hypothetical protein